MSNTRASQGQKVILSGGGDAPATTTQAHKVILLSIGSVPSLGSQAHKILIVPAFEPEPAVTRRRGFMNFRP